MRNDRHFPRSVPMFLLFLLWLLLFGSDQPALAADSSMFEENDKDAESTLVLEVDKDRAVRSEENRKFVESSHQYLKRRIAKLEEELAKTSSRLDSLEAALKSLLEKEDKS